MEKRINKKKIVSICPSRVARSQCPSIKKTRRIRRDLFRLQRDPSITEKTIMKLRLRLKQSPRMHLSRLSEEEIFPNNRVSLEIIFFHAIIHVNEAFNTQER